MSDGEGAMTRSLIPTGTMSRHWIGESSPARGHAAWNGEASSASTIERSEGRKVVETTQSGYGITYRMNADEYQWNGSVQR